MKANVGKADKFIRIVIGLAIISMGILYNSWFGIIGVIPILTAFIGFCPLYTLLGINTCPLRQKQ
jgi:hypothetical protein